MPGKTLLITRPEHDPGTRYLSAWSKLVIQEAEKKNLQIIDLYREKATRKEFEGRILKTKPSLILMNGHGDDSRVGGHDNEPLVELGKNETLLHGRITYAIACCSAKKLGYHCADEKTTYIGYTENFMVNADRKHLNEPLKDKRAAQFLDASNQVPLSLIKGHTVEQASIRSKEAFKKAMRELLGSPHRDPDTLDDLKTLWWDMEYQVCLGNKNSTLSEK